jgi:hypothetical protein
MFRKRFLISLAVLFLGASAAWADDVGYVDCSNHSEDTQVFGKPRKTNEIVASVPCGERFTVLVYGFFFSRIQTKDGQIGFIYSSLIAVDRAATTARQSGSVQMASDRTKVPSTRAAVATTNPPAQPQPAPAQQAQATAPVPVTATAAPVLNVPTTASSAPATPSTTTSAPATNLPEVTGPVSQPAPPAAPQTQPAPDRLAQTEVATAPVANTPEPAAPAAQPAASAPVTPEPAPAEPATPAVKPANTRTSWEKRTAPGLRRAPVLELFGGYAFARLDGGGGSGTNVNGALGSIGWNAKPWLQIVADTSYNVVTVSGTKNILYGNHYGPRYFHRGHNRWGLTPFAEALVGGSRADTSIVGVPGYNTSQNCISYKIGGGLDIHPYRRFDIRLFDIDYYRTAFGTNAHQNNYWATTGIVIRLFDGNPD